MGKAKAGETKFKNTPPAYNAEKSLEMVQWAAKELTAETANKEGIIAKLAEAYPGKEITVAGKTISSARTAAGFGPLGGAKPSGTPTRPKSSAPTVEDLRNAKKLADQLKMKPSELAKLVADIDAAGFDLDTLAQCLTALEEFSA